MVLIVEISQVLKVFDVNMEIGAIVLTGSDAHLCLPFLSFRTPLFV